MPDDTLYQSLSRVIETTGPISIARFMAEANAAYYGSRDPLGAAGDFVTAPEISQMFGEMIGLWCVDIAVRANAGAAFAYVELGPGRGTLAADALRTMKQFGLSPDVHFVETSQVLRRAQAKRVADATFHDSIDTLPNDRPLVIVANEFFDALPIEQYVATNSGWRDRVVCRHRDALIAVPGSDPRDDAIPEDMRRQPAGMVIETCSTARDITSSLAAWLASQGGVLLAIDYGYEGPKAGDTLQSVRAHDYADPFAEPGHQDLTAHVDFTALADAASAHDVVVSGPVEQGKFLHLLGIGPRAEALRRKNPPRETEIIAQYHRLTDPYEMGSLFKVMALTAASWPQPEGFA